MGKRTLYIVRHGQYDSSIADADGGDLTELGHEQAELAGQYLAQLPISTVHCSTMVRARTTARIIAAALAIDPDEIIASDLLREAVPIIPPRFATHFFDLIEQDNGFDHDRIHRDRQRADAAYEHYFVPARPDEADVHDLLVCHGNILRYFTCRALNVDVSTWANMNIYHCGITSIEIGEDGLPRLIAHNETGHLPPKKITEM